MRILTALLVAVSFFAAAQSPQVPHKMRFAEMTLIIRDDARRQIQKDVDALTQSPKHYNIKADRARTYFPVIEKIFAEEGVPDDFKYLVLQESSLVADAVSVSNAVGFWQFKDFTAMEMGLRVDKQIDERMNIASSTRAAARYIKKNNTFFDNWIFALQAYQMGAGGVMRSVKDTHGGKNEMEITSDTYWYVKKFLAYKIAYEPAMKGRGEIELIAFQTSKEQELADIAAQFSVSEDELRSYNKWVRDSRIPSDRSYVVVIPNRTGIAVSTESIFGTPTKVRPDADIAKAVKYSPTVQIVNGIKAVQALPGETPVKLAERVNVDLVSLLKWNEITYNTPLIEGTLYYLGKKKRKAKEERYTLKKGETLWMVSQKYGVRVDCLRKFNRLDGEPVPGTVLWLSKTKPANQIETSMPVVAEEDGNSTEFNWTSEQVVVAKSEESDSAAVIVVAEVSKPVEQTITPVIDVVKTESPVQSVASDSVVAPAIRVAVNGEHVVQPKETLYGIAHLYNVTVMDIVRWNNLDLQQGLKIGQILKIEQETTPSQPVAEIKQVQQAESVFHEVKESDTLYSIARKYGVTIKELMDLNEKKDFSLSVGEKLKVKNQ